jgi:hypothetical protein
MEKSKLVAKHPFSSTNGRGRGGNAKNNERGTSRKVAMHTHTGKQ